MVPYSLSGALSVTGKWIESNGDLGVDRGEVIFPSARWPLLYKNYNYTILRSHGE